MREESGRGDDIAPEGRRAAEVGAVEGDAAAASTEGSSEGVLTLVCFKCGEEYYFTDSRPPEGMSCAKCGNRVFREFYSPEEGDEAAEDFTDSTARELNPDDAEGDVLPGDLIDLNRD